jgi:hypothetical protein
MPAPITKKELHVHKPVAVSFGFGDLPEKYAKTIMRDIMKEQWPEQDRPEKCVYIVRLRGEVAVQYPSKRFSPVVYVGEGNARKRVYSHVHWLVPLLVSVPQLEVEIDVVEVLRKNQPNLYKHVEADLLAWFSAGHGSVPWFNKQRETSKEGHYEYVPAAKKALGNTIALRSGAKYQWAIQPTKNNDQHDPFAKGVEANDD